MKEKADFIQIELIQSVKQIESTGPGPGQVRVRKRKVRVRLGPALRTQK